MSDIVDSWNGSWNARLLATYQPIINKSVLFTGAPFTRSPDSSTRVAAFLNYTVSDWSLGFQDSWVSGFSQVGGPILPAGSPAAPAGLNNWVNPHVNSWNQLDFNITRSFVMDGTDLAAYFVVQNMFNAPARQCPHLYHRSGSIQPPRPVSTVTASKAPMGRTFTLGLRAAL